MTVTLGPSLPFAEQAGCSEKRCLPQRTGTLRAYGPNRGRWTALGALRRVRTIWSPEQAPQQADRRAA